MEQIKKGRTPKLICITGTNGTGKTTLIGEFANIELKAKRRALIITPHENEWIDFNNVPVPQVEDIYNMVGIGRIHYTGDISILEKTRKEFFNGLLVLDDSRFFIKPNIDQFFRQLLISRRQMMTDIIISAHNIADIPVSVFYYGPTFILKKTTTSFEARKKLLPSDVYNRLVQAQERINKNPNKYYYELIK